MAWGAVGPLGLMWIPALVSIAMRLIYREGFGDVGWRAGRLRYWAWAYLGPVGFAAFTYGCAWLVGAVVFHMPPALAAELGTNSAPVAWAISTALAVSAGFAIGLFYSFGEELGWRGYLLTRMVEAQLPAPLLSSGLIWSLWHLPLVLWGGYATSDSPWLSALLFTVCISFAGMFVGWLRLAGGSVWTAVIMHTAHNTYYQAVFDPWFDGRGEAYFAGEAGVFSIVAYGGITVWLWRSGRLRQAVRSPVLRPS